MGKRRHAAQEDIWKDLRSVTYAGLGDCARLLHETGTAIGYYQRSLFYDRSDPLVHFALALEFAQEFNDTRNREVLVAAKGHFQAMLSLNNELVESKRARDYLDRVETLLAEAGR